MSSPEPRFARIAALIADPTRARMLALLLGGEFRSAGELAKFAGITAQAASTQLAQLVEGSLLSERKQGRHKYFALADAEIAHALEALALVAERDAVSARWLRPGYKPLKCARRCYGHLAGELGVMQFEMLLHKRYLTSENGFLELSEEGAAWIRKIGAEPPAVTGTRLAYPCMDWSERKDHLAGPLARALLDRYLENDWLRADQGSRSISVTPLGAQKLLPMLGSRSTQTPMTSPVPAGVP